ncbi:MAG: ribosome-associated translation inhibitor RaiA [Clostridia bacterium]|nr:ribosome-associated translation inhibitor RaiA [Clostridia bacterium]
MEIKIVGKEITVTDAINDYVEKKLERIEKYFENATADVTLKANKNEQTAEIFVKANGYTYMAAAEDKDLYASIDRDMDILEGQIRKEKTKREKVQREGSLRTMEEETDKISEIRNEIVKTSYYEIKPITPEDAVLELQARPTHNFLSFINVETGKVNTIYTLKDGKNYGLVEPEA